MLIPCPLCGPRDRREFYYLGADDWLSRPAGDVDPVSDWLHNRDNPAGDTRDLWYHEGGCAQWLRVTRNTVTHAVERAELVAERDNAR
jgi:methylglutamate dehydrogenase subunit B